MGPGGPMGGPPPNGMPPIGGGRQMRGRGPAGTEPEFDIGQMEKECEEMIQFRYLTEDNCTFQKTPGGFLSLDYNNKHYNRVQVFRTFPFSDKDSFISIREANEKAREIGIIKDLHKDMSEETAALLTEQMDIRYFTPTIEKIYHIKEESGYAYFNVETAQGHCQFTIRTNGNSVIRLSDKRLFFTDLDGNRFEIPDLTVLSAGELKKLDVYI